MIPYPVIERVFRISFGNSQGSCFAIEYDDRQYLITAAHCVKGIRDTDEIQIWRAKEWTPLKVGVVGIDYGKDIAVLAASEQMCFAYGVQLGLRGLCLGQDVFFVGFPFGLSVPSLVPAGAVDNKYPIPIVKKATVAALPMNATPADVVLDGINNRGFSGGPVIFQMRGDTTIENGIVLRRYRVAGIVSGYIMTDEPVQMEGKSLKPTVAENTGLIKVVNISRAMRMIVEKPIGAAISKADSPYAKEDGLRKHRYSEPAPNHWFE